MSAITTHRGLRHVTRAALALSALLLLPACVTTVSSGAYHPYVPSSPSVNTLRHSQAEALAQGCGSRYGFGGRKYNQCINGYRHSEDALQDGCINRYRHDPARARRCMGY